MYLSFHLQSLYILHFYRVVSYSSFSFVPGFLALAINNLSYTVLLQKSQPIKTLLVVFYISDIWEILIRSDREVTECILNLVYLRELTALVTSDPPRAEVWQEIIAELLNIQQSQVHIHMFLCSVYCCQSFHLFTEPSFPVLFTWGSKDI